MGICQLIEDGLRHFGTGCVSCPAHRNGYETHVGAFDYLRVRACLLFLWYETQPQSNPELVCTITIIARRCWTTSRTPDGIGGGKKGNKGNGTWEKLIDFAQPGLDGITMRNALRTTGDEL